MNDYLAAVMQDTQDVNPVLNHLGIRVEQAQNGTARLRLDASEHVAQGAGMTAGGIIATLLDEAMAHAMLSALKGHTRTATIDMHVQYLSGVRPGTVLHAEAQVVKNGSSIAFVRAQATTPQGKVAATATASFFLS